MTRHIVLAALCCAMIGALFGAGWADRVAVSPDTEWWNKWITLKLDFGFTTPGQVTVDYYLPWET